MSIAVIQRRFADIDGLTYTKTHRLKTLHLIPSRRSQVW